MGLNFLIVIPAFNRPEYLCRVLDAIHAAESNAEVFVSVDRAADGSVNPDIVSLAGASGSVSERHLGCNGNVLRCLQWGFERSNRVLVIEDDIVIAPDALRFASWAFDQLDADLGLFSLWRSRRGWLPDAPYQRRDAEMFEATVDDTFPIWGWGTTIERWPEIQQYWTKGDDSDRTSWDVVLHRDWPRARRCLSPLVSRSQNIGQDGGRHRGRAILPHWSGMPYRMVDTNRPKHAPENAWQYGSESLPA